MPRLGSGVVDERGVDLIHRWIAAMATSAESTRSVTRQEAEVEASLKRLRTRGATSLARAAEIDRLLASTTGSIRLMRAIDDQTIDDGTRRVVISKATRAEPHIRDLFERYLPEEKRTRRLGTAIESAEILALPGKVARGERLFFDTAGVQCKNCHRIGDRGDEVGPDLSEIGKKYDRAALLESILEPSRRIDAKYVTYLLQTNDGNTHVGLLVEKGANDVALKEAQNKLVRVPASEVELLVPQPQSLMPELLLRDMTGQQVADLVAYLHSLR